MYVLLCNEDGQTIGRMEKVAAHQGEGALHKAFSICVFSEDKLHILMQKRSTTKMLFGGLWANTCCSHPQEQIPLEQEAEKRLEEECGFRCPLTVHSTLIYKAHDPNEKGIEWEYDTILIGTSYTDTSLHPHPDEVAELQWIRIDQLQEQMQSHPEQFAPWFPLVLHRILHA